MKTLSQHVAEAFAEEPCSGFIDNYASAIRENIKDAGTQERSLTQAIFVLMLAYE